MDQTTILTKTQSRKMRQIVLSEIDFGQPEAEHDTAAIQNSFYEADSWRFIASGNGKPFIVGRKGAGKSAIAARLEYLARANHSSCFVRIVPASFRHVEVRDLLACLVNRNSSWQYIYRKVWEGLLIGQLIQHADACRQTHDVERLSPDAKKEIDRFRNECSFYMAPLGDALSDVITNYVRGASKKTDALSQVELRKMLEPYTWSHLVQTLQKEFVARNPAKPGMYIAVDGLDEHWDTSEASLYFLAELIAVTKNFSAIFGQSLRFVVCLRDNMFRALVDTKSIEYDKIESLIVNLEWNSRSLFELIARRVAPNKRMESAVSELRDLLPGSINDMGVEEYLARHILQRPRDYINFFRMLQAECGTEPKAGEGHVHDALGKYSANRLVDLENEFGLIYPEISRLITALQGLPETFEKDTLIDTITKLCKQSSFRTQAPKLMLTYSNPLVLGRILLSIGVIGVYDPETHALRFVHEFSETRVTTLWQAADVMGIHPVYSYKKPVVKRGEPEKSCSVVTGSPAIVMHPSDYIAEKDSIDQGVHAYSDIIGRKRADLITQLTAIEKGQAHFRRFETWVRDSIIHSFIGDLGNAEEQIQTVGGGKRFEVVFDILGEAAPWSEIKSKYQTHRLLVECKNTADPTDADFNKLDRDMQALDLNVTFMAYRGAKREPTGKVLEYQRSVYINSQKRRLIVTLSEAFLIQCLEKKSPEKVARNFNALWRDHLHRYLVT